MFNSQFFSLVTISDRQSWFGHELSLTHMFTQLTLTWQKPAASHLCCQISRENNKIKQLISCGRVHPSTHMHSQLTLVITNHIWKKAPVIFIQFAETIYQTFTHLAAAASCSWSHLLHVTITGWVNWFLLRPQSPSLSGFFFPFGVDSLGLVLSIYILYACVGFCSVLFLLFVFLHIESLIVVWIHWGAITWAEPDQRSLLQ